MYPLLSLNGIIAFHDTLRISGCREFIIDLRTNYYDGTYDIVNFPYGNGNRRVGVSLLVKRTYPTIGICIDEEIGSKSKSKRIYLKEQNWFKEQQIQASGSLKHKGLLPSEKKLISILNRL